MRRTALMIPLILAATVAARPAPQQDPPPFCGTIVVPKDKDQPMFLETVRIVTDWLNDGTYGVNALLSALPLDGGDSVPAVALITDETRNAVAARERFPAAAGPVITVHLARPAIIRTELQGAFRDAPDVPVLIRYADTNQAATDAGTKNALYTVRAILQSVARLMDQPGVTARVRNQVAIANVKEEVQHVPVFQDVEDKVITGGLVFSFYVRDKLP